MRLLVAFVLGFFWIGSSFANSVWTTCLVYPHYTPSPMYVTTVQISPNGDGSYYILSKKLNYAEKALVPATSDGKITFSLVVPSHSSNQRTIRLILDRSMNAIDWQDPGASTDLGKMEIRCHPYEAGE